MRKLLALSQPKKRGDGMGEKNGKIWLWLSKAMGSHFGEGAPPILVYFGSLWCFLPRDVRTGHFLIQRMGFPY